MYSLYIVKRTQIYLNDLQDQALAVRAKEVGSTKSALIREAIDGYLESPADNDAALARLRVALSEAAGVASDLASGIEYVETLRAADRARVELHDSAR